MRVAGTAVEPARDDERTRTLIVSDLHVPLAGGEGVVEGFARICTEARADAGRTRLLVLGDLFDAYLHVRQLACGDWARVVEEIARTVAAGVPVTVLHGNRDFLLDGRFEGATGCRVVPGGLAFGLGGRRVLALHGDELCTNDVAYQRAKRVLRHPLTRLIARNLPLAVALRAGGRARQRSREHLDRVASERLDPVGAVVAEAFAAGFDLLVFGHIHRPARGHTSGGEYCVLPAFDQTLVLLEAEGDEIRYRTAAGEPVPDYPPRAFA